MEPQVTITLSNFRTELGNTISHQIGYLTSQFEDGDKALEELDGAIAFLFDKWLKRAYIAGHAQGVQACQKQYSIDEEFSADVDAIYAERSYLNWKSS